LTATLQELITLGDTLLASSDFGALGRVIAELESCVPAADAAGLQTARAAVSRWQLEALACRQALAAALVERRSQRGALRAYGYVAAA
jgi:hypothetical protein